MAETTDQTTKPDLEACVRDEPDIQAASITAACKLWYVNSGEFVQESEHWGVFWEPMGVRFSSEARPHCCYSNTVVFYDRNGNNRLGEVQHYDFMAAHPQLLFLAGKWREVVSGRCEFYKGQWCMRWAVATNTRWARFAAAAQAAIGESEVSG